MSIRINAVPPKTEEIIDTTKIPTEDVNDETNKTKLVSLSDVTPYTWGASDEDSPLSTGILYTTEIAVVNRTIKKVICSVNNAPDTTGLIIDILKETGVNTDVFLSIFSVLVRIDIEEFTSTTATTPPVLSTNVWETGRRLRIQLQSNDAGFAASGLKVTIKS